MPITKIKPSVNVGGTKTPARNITKKVIPRAPIAQWLFTESAAPFSTVDNKYPLQIGTGTIAPGHSAGTNTLAKVTQSGRSGVRFGGQNWLIIPTANVGELNIGATTGAVTVSCWFYNEDTNAGAVAGVWQEDNTNPKRSYCLFYDLPYYNGDDKVCGHVSKTGGASPGYPFSIDYSTTPENISRAGVWEHYAFTYDGVQAISYLNGVGTYRNPGTFVDPDGKTHTEVKNPYSFSAGLNAVPADFTVGAVALTAGFGNLIRGVISDLRVYNVALTPQEIQEIAK